MADGLPALQPHRPTGGTADLPFFEKVVDLARTHNLVIAARRGLQRNVLRAACTSLLQVAGAREVAVEFHSLSKTYNMTGWRVGFAIGGAP